MDRLAISARKFCPTPTVSTHDDFTHNDGCRLIIFILAVDHARSSSHLFRGSVHSIAINDKRANSVGGFEMDIQSSRNHSYETVISDYTVRAVTDVVYFRINRMLYKAAVNATQFEKAHGSAAALTVSSSSTNQPRSNWTNATQVSSSPFFFNLMTALIVIFNQEEERRYSTSSTNQRPSLTGIFFHYKATRKQSVTYRSL